jgi:hypothetical protein
VGIGAGVGEHKEHPLQLVQALITVLQLKPDWSKPSQVLPMQLSEHPSAASVGAAVSATVKGSNNTRLWRIAT